MSATSVGEDFPRQHARVRRSVQSAFAIGPSGRFYTMMGEDLLRRADEAMASGDVVRILTLYQEMTEWAE